MAWTLDSFLEEMTTLAPSDPSFRAISSPMPAVEAVIIANLLSNLPISFTPQTSKQIATSIALQPQTHNSETQVRSIVTVTSFRIYHITLSLSHHFELVTLNAAVTSIVACILKAFAFRALIFCFVRLFEMWKFVSSGSSGDNPLLETLNGFIGRQYWEFDPDAGTEADLAEIERLRFQFTQNRLKKRDADDALLRFQSRQKLHDAEILLPMDELPSEGPISDQRLEQTLEAGVKFFECLQEDDGHWPADYGGPLFLLPGLAITAYVTKTLDQLFPTEAKREVIRYLKNHQNSDGGFGLHIEGHSSMFGTSLNYVLLRLMGLLRDDPVVVSTRAWIHSHKGAIYTTSWAKFWLSVLGVYKWEGINPLPPEMWILPYSKLSLIGILHPGRMWCHCRMVGSLIGARMRVFEFRCIYR